jgi:hypothetical protein
LGQAGTRQDFDRFSVRQIAAETGYSSGSISRIVKRLQRQENGIMENFL